MDGRFNPYDSPGQQRQQAHALQAALEMEEALYLQRQQEMQRDLQIRQMLLQDQIDQQLIQGAPQNMLQQQRLYDLQNYAAAAATQNPLAAFHEEQMLQQQLQQQEQLRRHQIQQEIQLSAALASQQQQQQSPARRAAAADQNNANADSTNIVVAADSLPAPPLASAAAAKKPNQVQPRKRSMSQEESNAPKQPPRKQAKKNRSNSINKTSEAADVPDGIAPPLTATKKKSRGKANKKGTASKSSDSEKKVSSTKKAAKGSKNKEKATEESMKSVAPLDAFFKGTVEELVAAAEAEQKVQDAVTTVLKLKEVEPWSDSEDEGIPAESIELPGFSSKLPRLMEEPEYDSSRDPIANTKKLAATSPSQNGTANNISSNLAHLASTAKKASFASTKLAEAAAAKAKQGSAAADYPFSVDTWWPSSTTIRRERRIQGEISDEEERAEDSIPSSDDPEFRADLASIRRRLANDVEPGVLEKMPHCKIHRMRMSKHKKKGDHNKVEPVFCWQTTENTCNDVMLCCSVCSTWRHAFCGGHYQPYTIQSMLDSSTPFTPICDRCHAEEELLRDFPKAQTRIERQRIEQLRRGLATSAVIRQASFAKHGGTYKWPLGSVSATHIGGHTRSVHSRHDKAEKQWGEMAIRLSRGLGYRPKERSKVRTRELERLLVSVEDAEGIMDRHNMMLFLQRDTSKDYPVGFAQNRRNLLDPEDDYIQEVVLKDEEEESESGTPEDSSSSLPKEENESSSSTDNIGLGTTPIQDQQSTEETTEKVMETPVTPDEDISAKENEYFDKKAVPTQCARKGCMGKPRFDSMFCSDSCGVSALEMDLLRSLEYAGDIHPSLLRS